MGESMDTREFAAALGPLWDSHPVAADALTRHDERLRRRLAEVEAERDEAVRELDADDYEDQVCARVAAERRLAEVEQALRDVIAWVGQIGYPYDFTTIPPLPDQFVRPLAEWWWHDSGEDGTVDEWEDGIADEAQIAGRAVLDKGKPDGR